MFDFLRILFDLLKVRYTDAGLKDALSSTPRASSMLGLGAVLLKYGIPNKCVRIVDKADLAHVDTPCIVYFHRTFAIVESVTESGVSLVTSTGMRQQVPLENFFSLWDGVLMLLSVEDYSGEADYAAHRRTALLSRLKLTALAVCIVLAVALVAFANPLSTRPLWWALVLVNAVGVGVSCMLLAKQLHIPVKLVDRICGFAKSSGCDDVASSSGSSLFGVVKLGEVGMAFFLVNVVMLLSFPGSFLSLGAVSVAVLPFSLWSVWYQKFRVRSWCVLCLSALGLMWVQAALYCAACLGGLSAVDVRWFCFWLVAVSASYGASVLAVNRAMEFIGKSESRKQWQGQYLALKYDGKVVASIEGGAPTFSIAADVCSSLLFGNPEALRRITIVSNPYCGPCAAMHKGIEHLPNEYVCVSYVMVYFNKGMSLINRYIVGAYQQLGPERAWELLCRWYDGGKSRGESFFEGLGIDPDTPEVHAECEKHEAWCRDERLTGTPTVLVNGREVVYPYDVNDYIYMPL